MRKKRNVISRIKYKLKWYFWSKWIFELNCKTKKGGCKVCGGDLIITPVGYFCKNPNCNNKIVTG